MRLFSRRSGLSAEAKRIAQQFDLNAQHVARITGRLLQELRNGLQHSNATQIPSYVTDTPTGAETGLFLSVDLGGTNCRICAVELHGDSTYTLAQQKYAVPRDTRVNDRHEPLFAFIADKIGAFLDDPKTPRRPQASTGSHGSNSKTLPLGFTFSFTYRNTSLAHGRMLQWDKGWEIPSAVGCDPAALLQDALDARALPVRVVALINDSVGTVLARAYTSPGHAKASTLIGAIFGTGTNAAYLEKAANLPHVPDRPGSGYMILNTEWGGWANAKTGQSDLPTTRWDELLDAASSNPGRQRLEKRASGLYLGELARLAILHLAEARGFDMHIAPDSPLHRPYSIDSSFLTKVAGATPDRGTLGAAQAHVADVLQARRVSARDVQAVRAITTAIVRRAARLAGAAMAAIVIQSGRLDDDADQTIDIGVDGQLFQAYPTFASDMRGALRDVPQIGVAGEQRIEIGLTKDGSGVGAALAALVADEQAAMR